jgi:hypothetical protein
MAARLVVLSSAGFASGGVPASLDGAQRSPLTLGVFAVMASYYVFFYGGVLRRTRAMGGGSLPAPGTQAG